MTPISGKRLCKVLKSRGWILDHISGSHHVYTHPDARRKGVFRSLYEHIHKAACADPQVVGIRLYMEQDNHAAQQTYLSLGMKLPGYVVLERCPL